MPYAGYGRGKEISRRHRSAATRGKQQREAQGIAANHLLRFSHDAKKRGVTIALMAKFKPARGKAKSGSKARPPGAVPCVVIIFAGILLVMLFLYYVLRNANG